MIQEMAEQKDYQLVARRTSSEWLATYALRHADRFLRCSETTLEKHLESSKLFSIAFE